MRLNNYTLEYEKKIKNAVSIYDKYDEQIVMMPTSIMTKTDYKTADVH